MAKFLRLLLIIMGVLVAQTTLAAAADIELLGGQPTPLTLQVSKGQLIRLDQAAASVFIADPQIADVEVMSPRLIYVFGRMPGQTNLFAVSDGDAVLANVAVTVTPDLPRLGQAIEQVAPGQPITVTAVENNLLMTGSVSDPAQAADVERLASSFAGDPANVINRTSLAGANQVNLRVRIAEVSREAVRQLGINWDAMLETGEIAFGIAAGSPTAAAGNLLVRNAGTNSIFGSFSVGSFDVNSVIDALASENMVHLLAEPNLTAVSGETASFLAGGEFPIPTNSSTDANGNRQLGIEFKEFGVSLAFTPTILSNGRINMRVRPEVSALSDTGSIQLDDLVIPALTTRRAETTVELGSGQSFAIAGLFQNNINKTDRNYPLLADLPIIGELFRSTSFQQDETELVIVVTPYIVQPSASETAMLPTDELGTSAPQSAGEVRPASYGFILK